MPVANFSVTYILEFPKSIPKIFVMLGAIVFVVIGAPKSEMNKPLLESRFVFGDLHHHEILVTGFSHVTS